MNCSITVTRVFLEENILIIMFLLRVLYSYLFFFLRFCSLEPSVLVVVVVIGVMFFFIFFLICPLYSSPSDPSDVVTFGTKGKGGGSFFFRRTKGLLVVFLVICPSEVIFFFQVIFSLSFYIL